MATETEIEKILNSKIEQLEHLRKADAKMIDTQLKYIESLKDENKKLNQELKEIKEKAKRAGRKKSLSLEEAKEIKKLRSEGVTVRAIAERLNTSMSTVNRVLAKRKDENVR